jgi:hypothetical protein
VHVKTDAVSGFVKQAVCGSRMLVTCRASYSVLMFDGGGCCCCCRLTTKWGDGPRLKRKERVSPQLAMLLETDLHFIRACMCTVHLHAHTGGCCAAHTLVFTCLYH